MKNELKDITSKFTMKNDLVQLSTRVVKIQQNITKKPWKIELELLKKDITEQLKLNVNISVEKEI